MNAQHAKVLRTAPLQTPTDLQPDVVREIAGALNILLADMFSLYLKRYLNALAGWNLLTGA